MLLSILLHLSGHYRVPLELGSLASTAHPLSVSTSRAYGPILSTSASPTGASTTPSLPASFGITSTPAQQKIPLLVTSVDSFTQRVLSYLQILGFEHVSVRLAISNEAMLESAESWQPDIVLCPFLTNKVSPSIYNTWITLVVHPGLPGNAGSSSLDWDLLGDNGAVPFSTDLLPALLSTLPSPVAQRPHWGTICFQATEDLDDGVNLHSPAVMTAVITALIRVYGKTAGMDKAEGMNVAPEKGWQELSVSLGERFLGGKTHERPLLQFAKRKPDWEKHTAEDVLRILNASDSQPSAMLHPLTSASKASLFAYGAHLHKKQDIDNEKKTLKAEDAGVEEIEEMEVKWYLRKMDVCRMRIMCLHGWS
ncbi:hypothetical protein L198_08181 [Cryptococcus wingfieldii CBS 7118]|uniref:Methionyl-tRNA formyltransferase n=1 Tax=Cryptococcus wingfieldii CBS 7118 TaxID=1295528 RepID=A0A1E3HFU4_9TREE|nr:hypothetical protein L198_08181 [Cryptococcus wingfieldii CBS 7118]ODN74995.1 hypothetical protein L198_08181 [Cryptococcus wingfieldii CBS 7118]